MKSESSRNTFDFVETQLNKFLKKGENDLIPYNKDSKNILNNIHSSVIEEGYAYYSASAFCGRKFGNPEHLKILRSKLFKSRVLLETRILNTLDHCLNNGVLTINDLFWRLMFGVSKKQGISFRVGLTTCIPTKTCGSYCYAHDSRERGGRAILRSAINSKILDLWNKDSIKISELIIKQIETAIVVARKESEDCYIQYKFKRRPRIRFSHIGDMVSNPNFANWIGRKVYELSDGSVDSIIYTRHKFTHKLDDKVFVINYSIDPGQSVPEIINTKKVRIVASSWGGEVSNKAEVNFLEHHDNGVHANPKGKGFICPVTMPQTKLDSCDQSRCTKCFDRII